MHPRAVQPPRIPTHWLALTSHYETLDSPIFSVIVHYITTSSNEETLMSNHIFQSFTASLPTRVNRLLLLAIAMLATAVTIVALCHGNRVTRAHASRAVSAQVAQPLSSIDSAATLLPAIVVTPDPEMTTLATITVRPERPRAVSANRDRVGDFAFDAKVSASAPRVVNAPASGSGFAMPYYSFSRSPRRSNKE